MGFFIVLNGLCSSIGARIKAASAVKTARISLIFTMILAIFFVKVRYHTEEDLYLDAKLN